MVLEQAGPIDASPLVLREMSDPRPGVAQVRVHVHCCALCRTDLHIIEGDLPEQTLPIIPGHQIIGTVDQLGEGCTQLHLGQRIGIAWLRHTCGDCKFCHRQQENLCPQSRYTGYHADGGYAEYAVIDEDFAYAIPDQIDDIRAAPLLCAGIIGYRALKRANVPDKGRLLLVGFGSSAHIVIQLALHRGHDVFVLSRRRNHQQLAQQMGAMWVGADAAELPDKVDSAIMFAPSGKLIPPTLAALDKGGTLSLAGIHMSPLPPLDYRKHLFDERNLRSVTANTREDGRNLLADAASHGVKPRTTTYTLLHANRALQAMKCGEIDGTGVLVMPD